MSFLAPGRLLLLVALLVLIGAYVAVQLRRSRFAVRFTTLHLLERVAPTRPGWRRHVPAAAFLLMMGLFVTGFARPAAEVQVPREQATVMVAVDVSSSMEATDVEPDRFTAAKRAAEVFVDRLPARFNVGIVSFSRSASVVVSPTTDRQEIRSGIENLELGPSTAIGEAIFVSLQSIAAFGAQFGDSAPPARIVLLSDGTNTSGRSPDQGAAQAAQAGVPVSTIAYGTGEGVIYQGPRVIPVPVDGPALERIAQTTSGRFYEAATGDELRQVYEDIGSSVGYRVEQHEIWGWFIGAGLLLACAAAIGSLLWFSRLP